MRRFAGACRFVFNRALARQNENHEAGNKYIPYGKMASWLVEWKNATETQWLKDAPSQPLQQSLKDLERAYKNFFQKRAAFPRFKKRGQNDAFRYPQGVKLDQENSRIFLPKLGWMRYRNSRQVTGVVKNVTVSQSCGKWYISIQTESEVSTPVHPSASMVGLDAGVAKLATLSDGTVFEPVNSFQKNQKRAAFPRFKKRGQNDAFRYPQGVKLDQENSRIFLPKLGWMRYRNSRQVTGVVQQSLKDLERAYKNFFQKRAAFPRFKKRGQNDAFRYPQGVKLDQENSRIFLPKLGWMRYRNSRQVTGVVKNVTVSQSCGKWYISIQTESEVSTPVHPSASMVGLDAGVAKLATLSDGTVFEPVNSFQKNQKKLARLQRQLSRKVKFSNNWQKQERKIQRLHSRIANIRRDYLHKVTTTVSKNHAMIVIEDLKVSNMSKSAAGTVSQPGRNVRAKSGLNRTILDQGWYEMRRQLEYKQLWRGGQVLAVPPAYTSQRCACCGHTAKENRLSQSKFRCQACGYTANADVNGARNILAAGHAVLACGEMVQSGRSLKQEPTEMIQATA